MATLGRSEPVHIGVDVGGTFTDLVATRGDRLVTVKVSSTAADPAIAVLQGLTEVLSLLGAELEDVTRLAHGTTVATNAAIERKGARVGLITTAGFEDVIEIGRLERSNIYDLAATAETPTFLAPRRVRIGVPERLDADGAIVTPLDEAAVREAVERLVAHHQVTSIAVGFLFSYLDPAHERRVREIVLECCPAMPVSLSSDVDPRFREYERFTTTLFDAYLKPLVATYLQRLEAHLSSVGRRRFYVMRSSGGLCSAADAAAKPVTLLKSGLAAGVIGACDAADDAGFPDVISVDIGGTSCDVALVKGGRPSIRTQTRLRTYPIRIPVVEVSTIGAGGGSIGWLDEAGGLHVGPESAGASPGPACYGQGATRPTITDASLILGYISPDRFAGGRLRLDRYAAAAAIEPVAQRLGMSVEETAAGMHRILNAAMTDEIRRISLHRGEDPRDYALVLLGGGGPLHGAELARDLGTRTLVIPYVPGLLAAYGLLVARISHEQAFPFHGILDRFEPGDLAGICERLDGLGRGVLAADAAVQEVTLAVTGQLRYVGQSHELDIALPPTDADFAEETRRRFERMHERLFGRTSPDRDIEFAGLIVTHSCAQPTPPAFAPPATGSIAAALRGRRPAYFWSRRAFLDTAVYERAALPCGAELCGPAIVEQLDTTIIVPPDATARVAPGGSILVTLGRDAP